ncbi:MAG: class I SAM-dependent methyltransferase [Alphaproteobacteria bacterium]|nr:class I SAM-dependent methyltransferase [Alphaproteobacteria bacterium]
MGLYSKFVLPWVLHLAMRNPEAMRLRQKVVPRAHGRVLEIGIGSGLNLPYYTDHVDSVTGLEPSDRLLAMARTRVDEGPAEVGFDIGDAAALPYDSDTFDTVVSTWTLCSIADLDAALSEVRRVLRPDGGFLFVEHGRSPEYPVRRWQDRVTPIWKRCAGGCHLNRDIGGSIAAAGFAVHDVDTGYLVRGPRFLTWHTLGRAVAR